MRTYKSKLTQLMIVLASLGAFISLIGIAFNIFAALDSNAHLSQVVLRFASLGFVYFHCVITLVWIDINQKFHRLNEATNASDIPA